MIPSLLTSFALLFAFLYQNWKRSQVQVVQELVPNCLLTSYPIVFITGKRSLFYFLGFWNQIPHWLASHGYAVFHLPLPWKSSSKRIRALKTFLNQKSQRLEKIHLFIDESSHEEVKALLEKSDFACLQSVTLIGHSPTQAVTLTSRLSIPIEETCLPEHKAKAPLFWILHQLWTAQKASLRQLGWELNRRQGELLLERAQFLAERDLLQRQRSPTLKT